MHEDKERYEHPENAHEYEGLKVNAGIADAPTINPNLKNIRKKRKQEMSAEGLFEKICLGDMAVLSQAVTLVESTLPVHQKTAQALIEMCLPYSGNSIRVGITGVPGAGKSSFIESLGVYLVDQGRKLSVLAIDPSSEKTKGSILGDKTRMLELSAATNCFIRPSPSSGSLGGVARKTRETIILCEAAGFDTIFVETVGVGQSETVVHSMVDFFLMIQIAGAGDELQGIKRGIMEMTDGIMINKADGANTKKAEYACRELKNALHLFPLAESGWSPRVLTCSALEKTGIDEAWRMLEEYLSFAKKNGYFNKRRVEQARYWMYSSIEEQLRQTFFNDPHLAEVIRIKEEQVLNNEISSFVAAQELLDQYFQHHRRE